MIKVLLADDEQGMRLIIKKFLEKSGGFEIVGEAQNGKEALELHEKHKPDVIFMDVEMDVMDGLSAAKEIADVDPRCRIVFATAHDKYALEAFKIYAFDYLVKPFDMDRVMSTLDKVKESVYQVETKNSEAVKPSGMFCKELNKIMIKDKECMVFVDMADIHLVQREERNTVIYTSNQRIVTNEPLGELQKRLNEELFYRCHKSYIINLAMISEAYPYGRWTYVIKLKNIKEDALMTYEKFNQLSERFA
ncbi:MAG: LytTR family DNA-binding domain-containing protein [Eubacteriales bacterium]